MKNILLFCFASVISVLFESCGRGHKSVDEGCYYQDFDNLKMWYHDASVTDLHAHSGTFSTFTDSLHEFSQTFEMDLGFARSKGYNYIMVSGWCFMEHENTKAGFIASIESPEKSLVYDSSDLPVFLKSSQTWGKATKSIKLPENAPGGTKIKVYLWSPQKQQAFLDDVEIQFMK